MDAPEENHGDGYDLSKGRQLRTCIRALGI